MKPSELKIPISVESYDEKTAGNYRNCYVAVRSQILKAQIKDLNEDCVKISRPYHLYFPRNKPSKIIKVGPGWFII